MAYLIECDRCGDTAKVNSTLSAEMPRRWLQFHPLELGDGSVDAMRPPIDGGVFCEACVKDLRDWRKPIPRAMPDRAA